MTGAVADLREIVRRRVDAEGLIPLARRMDVGVGQIRSICGGRAPLGTTIEQICRALDLEFYIGPPRDPGVRRASTVTPLRAPAASAGDWNEPVTDRSLAELLARLADHWETLDDAERRAALGEAVLAILRATGERERPALRRTVAWLGWRVLDGLNAPDAGAGGE